VITTARAVAGGWAIMTACAVTGASGPPGVAPRSALGDEHAAARAALTAAINADRVAAGAAPVAVDTLATVVAQAHALAMATGDFFSHYGSTGDAPYERYAYAGGRAHLKENVFQWRISGGIPEDAEAARARFSMARVHQLLMESPGHRTTILDPHRTHVGIGMALDDQGRELVVVEDFIARHAEIELPSVAWRRSPTLLRGRMIDRDARPLLVVLSREPAVRDWVTRGDPPPSGSYMEGSEEAILIPPWEILRRRDGAFETVLPLEPLAPGRFYGVVYAASARAVERAIARGRASTENGWPAAAFMIDLF
jgi:uncharacterized protein YkwD